MNATDHRLARLERAHEYRLALHGAERIIRWAVGTGQLDDYEADDLRAALRTLAPQVTFIAGTWKPPPLQLPVEDVDAWSKRVMPQIEAWERQEGIPT